MWNCGFTCVNMAYTYVQVEFPQGLSIDSLTHGLHFGHGFIMQVRMVGLFIAARHVANFTITATPVHVLKSSQRYLFTTMKIRPSVHLYKGAHAATVLWIRTCMYPIFPNCITACNVARLKQSIQRQHHIFQFLEMRIVSCCIQLHLVLLFVDTGSLTWIFYGINRKFSHGINSLSMHEKVRYTCPYQRLTRGCRAQKTKMRHSEGQTDETSKTQTVHHISSIVVGPHRFPWSGSSSPWQTISPYEKYMKFPTL